MPLYMGGGSEITDLNVDGVALDSLIMDGVEVFSKNSLEDNLRFIGETVSTSSSPNNNLTIPFNDTVYLSDTFVFLVGFELSGGHILPSDYKVFIDDGASSYVDLIEDTPFKRDIRSQTGVFRIIGSDFNGNYDQYFSNLNILIDGGGIELNDLYRWYVSCYVFEKTRAFPYEAVFDYSGVKNAAAHSYTLNVDMSNNTTALGHLYTGLGRSHTWSGVDNSFIIPIGTDFGEATKSVTSAVGSSSHNIIVDIGPDSDGQATSYPQGEQVSLVNYISEEDLLLLPPPPNHTENFESGTLGNYWVNAPSSVTGWSVISGATPSSQTGPSAPASGTYYAYVETSDPSTSGEPGSYIQGDTDILEWVFYGLNSGSVSFYCNKYGSDQGTLYLEQKTTSGWATIWQNSGDNLNNSWVSVSNTTFSNCSGLRFRNVAAGGFKGDVALDLISVTFN